VAVLLQAEAIATLRAEVERLTSELKSSETDRAAMKDRLVELNQELDVLRKPTKSASVDQRATVDSSQFEVFTTSQCQNDCLVQLPRCSRAVSVAGLQEVWNCRTACHRRLRLHRLWRLPQ